MVVTRVLTAAVLIALVAAALFLLPPRAFGGVLLAIVILAAYEWAKLVGLGRARTLVFVLGPILLGLYLLLDPARFYEGFPPAVVFWSCGIATVFWVLIAPPWVIQRWSMPKLAVAAIGWVVLFGAWIALVELQARSPWLVLAAMALVWIADSAAYFSGRAFGQRKLAPHVSPGKTWEGVFGGLAAVLVYAIALVPFANAASFRGSIGAGTIALWLLFALLLTAISIFGDLFESLLKRHAGVKDSGHLIPGHGGVLDRADALLAAMPPAALASTLFLQR